MTLLEEIREQPDVAARFLDRQLGTVRAVAAEIRQRDPSFVLVAARGSSDHAAIYAQYVLGIRNGLPVALAAPSMFSLFERPPRIARAAVVAISQSGESPDIVAVADEARRQGALAIAITNEPGSPLAAACDLVLPLEAGAERAVAATKTYTAQLVAIAAISAALAGEDPVAALAPVPAALERALSTADRAAELAGRHAGASRAIVLGRGYEYGTAREWALKLQELTHVLAHSWSSADFEHGPLALLEPGLPILAVLSDDPAGAALLAILRRLRAEQGTEVVAVSGRGDDADLAPLRAGTGLASWLAPIATIVPGQLFARALAIARGLDTEQPRLIAKVTRTR